MTKRMLIDATHAEETRVVVLDGNRLEDFDVETSTKRQLKGNIYLAKVVRVEPSLQACFVEYGGNRHGFLAFSEIHPDYYQIPVADRQRLIEQEAEEARREEEEADRELAQEHPARHHAYPEQSAEPAMHPDMPEADSAESRAEPEASLRHTTEDIGAWDTAAPTPEAHAPAAEAASEAHARTAAPNASAPVPESARFAPMPEPEAHAPAPEPAAYASAPEPEAYDPAPEPEAYAPAPESAAHAPMPEPEARAPAPEPEAYAAAPGPEGYAPAPEPAAQASAPEAHAPALAPDAHVPAAKPSAHTPSPEPGVHARAPEAHAPEQSQAAETEHHAPTSEPGAHALAPEPEGAAPAPAEAAPAETGDESGATAQQLTDPPARAISADQTEEHSATGDDAPKPRSRRAQPLIIESETLTGPLESDASPADSDSATDTSEPWDAQPTSGAQPHIAPTEPALVDTEDDTDLPFDDSDSIPESPPPETVGGEPDSVDEQRERRPPSRYLRNYKIQEVIRRRQILLVQVVKEERGTKGAALTTYLSLAGRFSVLMPNSPRGGGISRKITSATDRRRLKEVIQELDMPKGMGLIVRTAGANRPKPEIKRDCEYLLRLWDDIREHTLKSVAPALIYEEASLIKRAIRDVYSRDIDEIQVDGEEGWKAAHEFMRMLMPSHAKKVQLWRDPTQPLLAKYQVEAQLDAMLQPTVQLRSGGYLVINQTEALVAIDVNSGRSTRERNVEETALRTNLEAVDEVARQLRLRDLAGLIVIDLIDMEVKKHNAMVERRIKEALKNDRARIQVGHISHFGLLEMSRQRLRPSLAEASFILCPHCGGTGHVRSTENAAIHVLRGIEDEGSKRRAAEIVVHAATPIALYILNHKRDRLGEIEHRYAMRVTVMGDDTQVASQFRIDRMRPQVAREDVPAAITPDAPPAALPAPRWEVEETEDVAGEDEADFEEAGSEEIAGEENGAEEADSGEVRTGAPETAEEKAEQAERRRRRRRRRRGGRREDGSPTLPAGTAPGGVLVEPGGTLVEPDLVQAADGVTAEPVIAADEEAEPAPETHVEGVPEHAEPAGDDDARRRRGRRGGRRRRREPGEGEGSPFAAPGAEQPDLPPVYVGPTPANPFGGHAFDIFDVLEQVEASAAVRHEPAEPATRQAVAEPVVAVEAVAVDAVTGPVETVAVDAVTGPVETVAVDAVTGPVETVAVDVVTGPVEAEGTAVSIARDGMAAPEGAAGPEGAPAAVATAAPVETASMASPAAVESLVAPAESTEVAAASPQEVVKAAAREPASTELAGASVTELSTVAEAEAQTGAGTVTAAEPPAAEVANDVAAEPAIKPIIIGSGDEPAVKKRGWWRR